jgi:hypothetical protein
LSLLQNGTNTQQTHCTSKHLTSFAGGLVVMPNKINFQYVFANASFAKNYTIYLIMIAFFILYLIFALWSILMDNLDFGKLNIIPLKDNNPSDNYFYELMVFTGDLKESGTHSIVRFFSNFSIKEFFFFKRFFDIFHKKSVVVVEIAVNETSL